ncbi:MAG: glycoside hydrolase family 127 protein, partial [Proteiniphilum sp.]|nr:glycoside hydrolase family 127 protein [Proteiniphilum sp.]
GLRDAYLVAGKKESRDMMVAMSDWAIELTAELTDEQMQEMLRSEHGGLNEVFADVAAITGEEKYLKLAHRFSHLLLLEPLMAGRDVLTGMHANTQIPKVIGFKRIADLEANESWDNAARFFWEGVVTNRSVSIGGNSVSEHFNHVEDFSRMVTSIEGPETCNTHNMLRLTRMLYHTDPQPGYIDYYERALYNHILSSQNPHTGGLVYFTQMRPGHYRVYSQPHTSMWCCVGSGIENHSKYGEMIYAHTEEALYVNLFIPSRLQWKAQQTEILQENNFPYEESTAITINPRGRKQFTLMLRHPEWAKEGTIRITVNGREYTAEEKEGYLAINRRWRKGDRVVMEMPMRVRTEQLPDHSNYYSFAYGPIVLAARTSEEEQTGLFADDSRGGHIAHGPQIPLKSMPLVVGEAGELASLLQPVKGKPLTFRLTSLYPDRYTGGMELTPFFSLHESRYIIYWPQATRGEAEKMHRAIEKEETRRNELNNKTVDLVVSGEQQPESDHFIASEESRTGVFVDIHWREASGWFSYGMRNEKQNARYLYISYFDIDRSRNFDILVNDRHLESFSLTGQKGMEKQELLISLPEEQHQEKQLIVKFSAHPGSTTGKIAEVRLLSD